MAKFIFVGDPNDNFSGPDVIDWHGHRFPKGEAVEVAGEDAAKLAAHTHFKAAEDVEPAAKPRRGRK